MLIFHIFALKTYIIYDCGPEFDAPPSRFEIWPVQNIVRYAVNSMVRKKYLGNFCSVNFFEHKLISKANKNIEIEQKAGIYLHNKLMQHFRK